MTSLAMTRRGEHLRLISRDVSVARGLVERDDLLRMLDRAVTKRVTVIAAPPGSGKTSLLGPRLGLRGRPYRPGRLQLRPGKELCANATILRVRRLRNSKPRPPLHGKPRHRPESGRRAHTARRRPVNRAGLHPGTGRAPGSLDPVAAPRDRWPALAGESCSRQNENGVVTSESEGVRHGRVDGRYAWGPDVVESGLGVRIAEVCARG